MKNVLLFIFLFFSSYLLSQCTHTIRLTDTFGDGWNGGSVSVSVNGVVVLSNITLSTGFGPINYNFTASTGSTIRVYRTAAGTWPSEMRIQVVNNTGTILILTTQPVSGTATTLGTTCIGSCGSTAPTNDLVCNATSISCGQSISGTTINATNSGYGENGTCGTVQSYPGVWYKIVGNSQIMTASLCATSWDSKISIFSGTCTSLTCIGGVDDNGPACAGTSASYSWNSINGTTYWILVYGYSTNSNFSISLSCANPPTPGPCLNTISYGTQFMPVLGGAPYESINCQYAGEYSTWYNAISNTPYIVTSSTSTDWITIRSLTYNGSVIAYGNQPLSFIPTFTGTIFIHVNTNSYCATQSTCRNINVSRVSALPVELMSLDGKPQGNSNLVYWSTSTEHNSSHFNIEKSEDGHLWKTIGSVQASINSTQKIDYEFIDNQISPIFNYYRLDQVDIDGIGKKYGPIVIDNRPNHSLVVRRFNLLGQEVTEDSPGLIFEILENGKIRRTIK